MWLFLLALPAVRAAVTVYLQPAQAQATLAATVSANPANYTGVAAYNPTTLNAPPVPSPAVPSTFNIQLHTGGTPGASIQQSGNFLGFSIEMSVSNQVCTHARLPCLSCHR